MVIGLILILVAVMVVVVGTKESDAIVLYYDAVDITPEMVQEVKRQVQEDDSADVEDMPAAVTAEPKASSEAAVRVTMKGTAINSKPRQSPKTESLDEITAAAKAKDPVKVEGRAQNMFEEIMRGGGL